MVVRIECLYYTKYEERIERVTTHRYCSRQQHSYSESYFYIGGAENGGLENAGPEMKDLLRLRRFVYVRFVAVFRYNSCLCDTVISVDSVLRVSLRNCRLITSFYCFTPLVLHFQSTLYIHQRKYSHSSNSTDFV